MNGAQSFCLGRVGRIQVKVDSPGLTAGGDLLKGLSAFTQERRGLRAERASDLEWMRARGVINGRVQDRVD